MAEFQVLKHCTIAGRGFFLLGEIINGIINNGDIILFSVNEKLIQREIASIGTVGNRLTKELYTSLNIKYASEADKAYFATMEIKPQLATVENKAHS